ncbi:rhomboid-related protein 4 isoform X1 [Hydra vulgaris]|uniref:Rhomboid-related protein 4 isoform X1 n=1 Tax=Hydra vulgaris TaxID=6087 RepID=A0ABM4CD94_HYDVU
MMSRRQTRGGLGLLLLGSQVLQIGVDHIPPITLATLVLNVAVFLQLFPFMSTVEKACTSNFNVFHKGEWQRLIYSSFYHLDDMHLYFNMVSFIWKGRNLERHMKRSQYLVLLALFSVLTQVVMLLLNSILSFIFTNDVYLHSCAAGFSAVIFALKVLTTHNSIDNETVMGIVVPSRYACWAELVLIQIMVPNVSFTGHLAGILVGLMYIFGPLKWIVKSLTKFLEGKYFTQSSPQYEYRSTSTRTNTANYENIQNTIRNDEDEDLQRAIQNSLKDFNFQSPQPPSSYQNPPSYGWNVQSSSNIQPTAPFFETFDNSNRDLPYPSDEYNFSSTNLTSHDMPPDSIATNKSSLNINVREARLRKFEKQKNK